MASIYQAMYEKEVKKNSELATRINEMGELLQRAQASFENELFERDLLWETRDTMRLLEKWFHDRAT